MKNSEQYFHYVSGFIEDMAEINCKYEKAVQRLEAYKGSEGYSREIRAAQTERDSSIKGMRETYYKQFKTILGKMRDTMSNHPLVLPTQEQVSLLTVLQMRQSITRHELDRAAKQLADCPLALSVLDDLAEKFNLKGNKFNREVQPEHWDGKVDTLERSAQKLLNEGIDAARRRTPENTIVCMNSYGVFNPIVKNGRGTGGELTSTDLEIDTATIQAFCNAVDG